MLCLERLCFVSVFILPFNPDTFCSVTHHPLTTSSSDSYYLSMRLMDLRLSPAPGRLRGTTRLVTEGSGARGAFTPSAADGLSATTDNVSAPIVAVRLH